MSLRNDRSRIAQRRREILRALIKRINYAGMR